MSTPPTPPPSIETEQPAQEVIPSTGTSAPAHAAPPAPVVGMFPTHHGAVGSWASLVLGGKGAGICHESLNAAANVELMIGVQRGGVVTVLPFGSAGAFRAAGDVVRTLSACVDDFRSAEAGLGWKIFTPHAALPNPKRSGNLQYSTAPGVLAELTIDNSESDMPAVAFVTLADKTGGETRLRPVDWTSKALCGVAKGGAWLVGAQLVKDEVMTIQSARVAEHLVNGTTEVDPTADAGGVVIKVPARTKKSVQVVFAFYRDGAATQGIEGRYMHTVYFPRVEAAANFILQNNGKIRESCSNFDSRAGNACSDPTKLAIFGQAVRTYEAQTQVLDAGGLPHFATISGAEGYRNATDVVVDHLPWELYRNPWVIRNIFDLGTSTYSYHDKVRFAGEDEQREGGMTFLHDTGFASAYTPAGVSTLESRGTTMATEALLNGVYLLTSYALVADDTPWAKTRLPFARELLTSMENRDYWDPEKRTGILKAESDRAAREVTAFAAIDPLLAKVPGNVYLAVKTFCANLMLTTYFQNNNDLHSADYSYAFAQKTAAALIAAASANGGTLPANLLDTSSRAKAIAALEPLALPTYLGLTSTLNEYFPELFAVLKAHALACLKNSPEGCIDPVNGGLRLISSANEVSIGKVINVLYVLERLFGINVQAEYPTLWREVAAWMQGPESGDLVDVTTRRVVGARNSTRAIAAALFVKPA